MMTLETIKQAVKNAVQQGKTYSAIAKQSDVSATTLGQFINGTYAGDNEKVASKLQVWLDNQLAERTIRKAPTFVETPTSKKIFSALNYAQVAGCFVVVYGNSGVGKTCALNEYAKRPNTWLVTARPSSEKLSECLYDIACALDIEYTPRRSGPLSCAIQRRLKESKGLLIIDEADHLLPNVLEELRLIQEITDVGVVLCGNHQVYARLSGNGSRKTDFARLFSRIAKKVSILKNLEGDINAIANAWGINDERGRKLVHKLGERAGALRTIKTTLSLAAIIASSDNSTITEKHIVAAIQDLEGV